MSKSDHLVLIGPPNSGKTTLFNWLTGYNKQTVNYPGSTVEVAFGLIRKHNWKVVDTPGIYNFFPDNPGEEVTRNILKDSNEKKELKGVIVVLDSTRLTRQLPLFFQLKSMNIPMVVALTMYDIQKKSVPFDLELLSKELGVSVCPIEGLLGGGVKELLKTAVDVFKEQSSKKLIVADSKDWSETQQESFLQKAQMVMQKVCKDIQSKKEKIGERTRKVDSWLLHPVFGFAFLSLILFSFFSAIFWLAAPVMDMIDSGFAWTVDQFLTLGGEHLLVDFMSNGVLAGFGAFFVFVPQVFILFVGIYLLEDSGYLARAATLVDGPFAKIGLSGKSLFPFLSGFACAIPATLSARAIASKRERWITIFVIPFMTCSARLPVYALFLSFLFYGQSAWKPGVCMSLLYFLSLLIGIGAAGVLSRFSKQKTKSSFLMELPLYRRPIISSLLVSSWSRTKHFIWKAGPVIFVFSLLLWGATNFPRTPELSPSEQLQQSYAGQLGQKIEPAFEVMGADWRVGVSLISAFVAREVFVSVLAIVLKNTEEEDPQKLAEIMQKAHWSDGTPLFTTGSVMALLVFFLFSLQCLSTTGVVYKETGSWMFAAVQLVALNIMGYVGAVLTYWLF